MNYGVKYQTKKAKEEESDATWRMKKSFRTPEF